MEQHGTIPRKDVIAVIPARYASVRLPGKMLLSLAGTPLIVHTARQAAAARSVSRVIVATDDDRIVRAVEAEGFDALMTSAAHRSGSDRVAEIAETLPSGTIIVNVQGDEPLISPETIDRAVEALFADGEADIATTSEPIESIDELFDGNVVKVTASDRGRALYFSRSPIPFPRDPALRYGGDPGKAIRNEPEILSFFRRHTGLYVYRREYLLKFTQLPTSKLEKVEMLEQLRALENGAWIKVVESVGRSIGVDSEEDLQRVRAIIEERESTSTVTGA